ncbi:hypothetical protein ACM43_24635 [Bradyrhizobium sp. CCBAU 45321]|nr:hypothetical protein [Bradyrhizobium sp. CCBAU 45321]
MILLLSTDGCCSPAILQIDVRPVRRELILLRIALPRFICLLVMGGVSLLPRIIQRRLARVFVLWAYIFHDG